MRLNKWILDDTNEVDFEDAEAVNQTDGELNDTIITYEGNTSDVQSWTDFIGSFINGMKVGKFFKNLYAGIQYVLHVGSLVNNCVTDNSDLPLSAAQGKVLMDELTQIKSDLSELKTNVTVTAHGGYLGLNSSLKITGTTIVLIAFIGASQYGIWGARSNNEGVATLVQAGEQLSFTTDSGTYTLTNANTSSGCRYLYFLFDI